MGSERIEEIAAESSPKKKIDFNLFSIQIKLQKVKFPGSPGMKVSHTEEGAVFLESMSHLVERRGAQDGCHELDGPTKLLSEQVGGGLS